MRTGGLTGRTNGNTEAELRLSTSITVRRQIAAALSLFLAFGDIISTELGLRAGMIEANALPSYILRTYGKLPMYSLRFAVGIFVLVTVIKLSARYPRVWRSVSISNWLAAIVVSTNLLQLLLT